MKDYTIYVTEEIARKAKEKGYPQHYVKYINVSFINGLEDKIYNESTDDFSIERVVCPTAEQICGWLREEKDLVINISRDVLQNDKDYKDYTLHIVHEWDGCFMSDVLKGYNYEYLLLEGISKALDLI